MTNIIATWLATNSIEPATTPLIILAARQGQTEVLQHLLAQGADIDQLDEYGNNVLWAACYAESSACIALLLQTGIDINFQNNTGVSALMYSASAGKTEVVKTLLAAGADTNLTNQDDFSALDLVANRECFKLLREWQKQAIKG